MSALHAHRKFAPRRDAPGAARRFAVDLMREAGIELKTLEAAGLVISELATNAVVHARSPFALDVEIHDRTVHIEVADARGTVPTHEFIRTPRDTGGRGLAIVDELCRSWGAEPADGGGTIFWCELHRGETGHA